MLGWIGRSQGCLQRLILDFFSLVRMPQVLCFGMMETDPAIMTLSPSIVFPADLVVGNDNYKIVGRIQFRAAHFWATKRHTRSEPVPGVYLYDDTAHAGLAQFTEAFNVDCSLTGSQQDTFAVFYQRSE